MISLARSFHQIGLLWLVGANIATAAPQPVPPNLTAGPSSAAAKTAPNTSGSAFSWENAVIHMEVTRKQYSYTQPWTRSESKVYKTGVVLPGHLIITPAEGLNDQTLIRLKKQGGGLFSLGRVVWIDYQSDLAAVTTDEKDFWTGLQAARLADPVPNNGPVRIVRWDNDHLESRQGEIERVTVDNSPLSFVSVPVLRVDSTIPGAGYGEAITSGDRLLGIASQQDGEALTAIPSSFIASILQARQANTFTGLGYFDFTWDTGENPLCLAYLNLPGPARGVIVKETGMKPGTESPLKPRDVLLQIDGFDIDAEGNYRDPQYKKLVLENLSSRRKWAGAICRMKVWRDGKELMIDYKLPKADFADELVPNQSFDRDPEYVLAGGFVFVPLTTSYLRSWGADWHARAPFRLGYYRNGKVRPERPQRVVLSNVLPDEVNIGYESIHFAVVDEINGMKIRTIADIPVALKSPVNGFDVFKFAPGEPTREAVLDASLLDNANQKIMARFHIPTDHVLDLAANDSPAPSAATTAAVPSAKP